MKLKIRYNSIFILLTILFTGILFISCGGDDNNTTESCDSPKKIIKYEQTNGNYVQKCTLESECETELVENNGTYTCLVKSDFVPKATSCSDDYTSILDQNGSIMNTCDNGTFCDYNTNGSPDCFQ